MKSRNTLTITLMSASILLLLILQTLWLQNSYEKAFYDLRRDSNYLFRSTLFSLRDTLFLKSIHAIPPDLAPSKIESIQLFKRPDKDSIQLNTKSAVQVIVKGGSIANSDSIIRAIRPMAQNFNFSNQEGRRFIIQLSPDTLSMDSVRKAFSQALTKSELPFKFMISHEFTPGERGFRVRMDANPTEIASDPQLSVYRDTIKLETVRLNPVSRYSASLLNFRGFILKSIAPQILFSVLLTGITVLAFIILYRNLKSQQRLMQLKNDFISNVTHELKTPVATVSVALEALKNFHGLDNPKLTQEYLEIAQSELSRLTLMTDKILKAGAFENNEIVVVKKPVDVLVITQQILDSMKLLFDKNQARVTFETHGDNFTIEGEESHVTNVIYNLLDNALKYSPEQPQIHLVLKEEQNHINIMVRDNGLGIPAVYKTKIFEKFFRVPTGDIHNIKGYGLGLSYVASVVKAHGGTVDVESESGKGSNFTITLPKLQP